MSAAKKSYKIVSQRTSSELVDVLESGQTSTAGKTRLWSILMKEAYAFDLRSKTLPIT